MDKTSTLQFLSPFRVLDLTNEKGYYLCSKILGDLGADVIRVEKPGVVRDFWWCAYNTSKTIIPLDIEKEKDRLLSLVRTADFLVESFPPGYLDHLGLGYSILKRINPRLIMTSLTSFGQTGPHKDRKVSDLELMAVSGVMYGIGDPDRPPVRIGFPQSHLLTSAEAAVGTLIALHHREVTGEGQCVDVSAQESVHAVVSGTLRRPNVVAAGMKRMGVNVPPVPGAGLDDGVPPKYRQSHSRLIWKCKEGYVSYLIHNGTRGEHNNLSLIKYMELDGDLPDMVRNIRWDKFDAWQTSPEDMEQISDAFARLFFRHTCQELYEIAKTEKIELFPVNTAADNLTEEHLESRQFWQTHEVPELGRSLKFPGTLAKVVASAVPCPTESRRRERQNHSHLPFQGVKVLDFTWINTVPWITQWMAIFGAEVIKIESSSRPGGASSTSGGYAFVGWNSGKKSLTLNLDNSDGRELCRRLVKWANVITENFSPGTLDKIGFGFNELIKINSGIVMFSASLLGADGPSATVPGIGLQLASLSGFNDVTGWPDRSPVPHGPYTDIISCRIAAATLFAALDHQKRTGQGCCIDASQFEASLHFLAPLILEYQVTGQSPARTGNRSPTDSPHGVFPCLGEDRWCAISVSSDFEWRELCMALGWPDWGQSHKFVTFNGRKQNEDELESLIGKWTMRYPAEEVVARLQKVGVKSAVVAERNDLLNDAQLKHRQHFLPVTHAQFGEYDFSDSGFRLEKSRPVVNPAPIFGEHKRYVATHILGLSEEEYQTYLDAGAFG